MLRQVTVSIVSHGHNESVKKLAYQISKIESNTIAYLTVTSNMPSLDTFNLVSDFKISSLKFLLLENPHPLGFGANHNQAFKYCNTEYFCVLNPDIALTQDPFAEILQTLNDPQVGCAYPMQIRSDGSALDSERELASPWSIVKRHLPFIGQRLRLQVTQAQAQGNKPVHWVNGACMVFRSDVFRQLGGFDERYFMYGEDVDICLRLQLAGYKLARADATVVHDTQRRTLRDMRHFAWHVRSLLRLWGSDAYRDFKQRFIAKTG